MTAAPDIPAALSIEALSNLAYRGIFEQPVALTDGRFEGEPFVAGGTSRPVVVLLPEPVAYGDLDGDGRAEAVVLLAADLGGSGTFIYLSTVEALDDGPINTATTLLGDRITVRSLAIDESQILVNLLTHGPDDPACCPTLEGVRAFQWQGEQLIDVGN
jgi:hypothetical protein